MGCLPAQGVAFCFCSFGGFVEEAQSGPSPEQVAGSRSARDQMIGQTKTTDSGERGSKDARSHSPSGDRLLTINEVAELTGLTVGTLYHFVSQRRIPVVRLSKRCIRFRHSDLSHWIQTHTEGAR